MGHLILFLIISYLIFRLFAFLKKQKIQLAFISEYKFNVSIRKKLIDNYPSLIDSDIDKVFEALKDYFYICNQANKSSVSMPSQIVDAAWHEFILFTKEYEKFSENAFGRFLHHTPTEAMKSKTTAQEGIKRAWNLACSRERINSHEPLCLPRLFAIDSLLNIEDGFTYLLDCQDKVSTSDNSFCASHIACASGGGDGGCSGGGCSGGCAGGCGGGG